MKGTKKMAISPKELREEAAELKNEAVLFADIIQKEDRSWSSEELDQFTAKENQINEKLARAEALERVEKIEGRFSVEVPKPEERQIGKPAVSHKPKDEEEEESRAEEGPNREQQALCLQGWMRDKHGLDLKRSHIEAAKACGVDLRKDHVEFKLAGGAKYRSMQNEWHKRSLSNLNLAAGGALVPEGFMNDLEIALLAYGGVRDAARVMRTESGNPIPWPTVNDTTNKATLIAENTQVSAVDLAFQQLTFSAYKFNSGLVLVPVELMQDSAFNVESYVGELLGVRMARGLNDYYTTGTGASQPNGFITAGTSFSAASATAISFDDVIGLIHSVDPMYRNGATFMCHDTIKKQLRLLKDGMGRYLWQNGNVQAGLPDMIEGYPIITNQSMDSTLASGKNTLAFGQFNKFVVREVATLRLVVMRERYADYDQVGFVAFMRADSNLLDAGTHPLKYLAH